jgi:hypothetical protein
MTTKGTTNIRGRIEKLEAKSSSDEMMILWRHHWEADEQAEARWRAENPGKDLERAGLKVIIVRWADPQPSAVPSTLPTEV